MEISSIEQRHSDLVLEYETKRQKLLNGLTKEERTAYGEPIKSIDKLSEFHANGNRYTIRTSLTIERFELFETLQQSVGFGIDFRDSFANLKRAYTHLNEGRPADAAVVVHNQMNGVKNKLEERLNPVLELCTLFICRDGEDVTVLDPILTNDKIEDWKREGIDMDNFFHLAFSFTNGFTPVYNEVSQSISQHQELVKKAVGAKPRKGKSLLSKRRTK